MDNAETLCTIQQLKCMLLFLVKDVSRQCRSGLSYQHTTGRNQESLEKTQLSALVARQILILAISQMQTPNIKPKLHWWQAQPGQLNSILEKQFNDLQFNPCHLLDNDDVTLVPTQAKICISSFLITVRYHHAAEISLFYKVVACTVTTISNICRLLNWYCVTSASSKRW